VIATIPHDALLGFALTQLVAISAARQIADGGRLWQRPFQEALLFLLAIFLPASYSFFHFWPDWSWLYAFDTQVASPAWTVLGFAGVLAFGAGGHVLAHWLIRSGRRRWVYGTLGGALAVAGALSVVFHDRLLRLGTYGDFHLGKAPAIWEVTPFAAHLGVVLLFVCAGLLVILWGYRKAKREGG
jgi:hypothetical protein